MNDLKESVLNSLDGSSPEIYPYLSYLLQDLWEMGSTSENVLSILKNNNVPEKFSRLKILDLGCGKGGITIPIAKETNASVVGIDGFSEFINVAVDKSKQWGVENNCRYFCGDIRTEIKNFTDFNLVILASTGQILGDIKQTLTSIEKCLVQNGYVFLDDAYIPNELDFENENYMHEKEFYNQLSESSFEIIDKKVHPAGSADNEVMFNKIKRRAFELMEKYPDKKSLFESYLRSQTEENSALETSVKCVSLLLKKK